MKSFPKLYISKSVISSIYRHFNYNQNINNNNNNNNNNSDNDNENTTERLTGIGHSDLMIIPISVKFLKAW